MAYDFRNSVKSQKENQNFKKLRTLSVEAKKYERFLENNLFVHWPSLVCK